jgi:ketosteroid isomerase-like protein
MPGRHATDEPGNPTRTRILSTQNGPVTASAIVPFTRIPTTPSGGPSSAGYRVDMSPSRADPADFVRRFEEFWRAPAVERLDTVLAPDARLSAPLVPTTQGLEAGKRAFADLFELLSDMTAEVRRWGATEDGVLIELTVRATAAGRPISWETVDRFVLNDDGLASERFTYFDSLPLVMALALRPGAWPSFVRSRLKQLRG